MEEYIPISYNPIADFTALLNLLYEGNEILSASVDRAGKYGNHIEIVARNGRQEIMRIHVTYSGPKGERT